MSSYYKRYRNYGCRVMEDMQYKGYRSILLENDLLQIILLLDRGGEPVRWLHKPTDTDFIWHTRMGLLPPTSLYQDYQMTYMGGWQEMLPEVSETHVYRGAMVHRGESAITPWDYELIRDDEDEIRVRLSNRLRSLPLRVEKTFILGRGDTVVRLEETVFNESPVQMEFNWGHHLAFGAPFLNEHSRVEFEQGSTVVNMETGERCSWPGMPGSHDKVDLSSLADPGTIRPLLAIENTKGNYRLHGNPEGMSLAVSWDAAIWPYTWYWQNFASDPNAPFFGCEYNIGLEPFNIPPKWTLAEAVARGAALKLEPYGRLSAWLEIEVMKGGVQ
ncbi:DUF4432 family protein [Cohnella abietis]|uniref:DUF4432 domain-containing protein n=1 Tax=Cohnella abietis TaxID=2507935 RepID=A0A3T1DB96_9BACL|nr:DUF4432 family protein [Cohnella abietis]BBI35401.1 hypothetical protein KCTCHS21_48000 [Cohnella abietis]